MWRLSANAIRVHWYGPALAVCALAILCGPIRADENRMYLANQSDFNGRHGFYVDLENAQQGASRCRLGTLKLILGVADGNPCFYTGICAAPALHFDATPVSGRESLFAWLPPHEGEFASAWGKDVWGGRNGTE